MRRSIRTFRVGYFAGAFPKAAPVNGLPGVLEQHPQLILGDLAVELVGPADTGQTGAQPGPRRVPLRRVVPGRRRSLSGATAVASSSHIRDQGVHRRHPRQGSSLSVGLVRARAGAGQLEAILDEMSKLGDVVHAIEDAITDLSYGQPNFTIEARIRRVRDDLEVEAARWPSLVVRLGLISDALRPSS